MDTQVQQRIYWSDLAESKLTRHSLDQLFDGQIPYIRIANFASHEECEALVKSAVKEGFGPYRGVEPVINRIGNTVFEYSSISKHEYFEKNIDLNRVQKRIFARSFNPLERFIGLLEQQAQRRANVARNIEGHPYYVGLVRRIESGTLLHVDFAPGEQPDWEVAMVQEQLAWNLYLRVSDPHSGRTHIFDRQWQPADDALKEGIYGYNARVVAGMEDASFAPAVGEVVIFNTRNFHYVEPTAGERVSFTSASWQWHHHRRTETWIRICIAVGKNSMPIPRASGRSATRPISLKTRRCCGSEWLKMAICCSGAWWIARRFYAPAAKSC